MSDLDEILSAGVIEKHTDTPIRKKKYKGKKNRRRRGRFSIASQNIPATNLLNKKESKGIL